MTLRALVILGLLGALLPVCAARAVSTAPRPNILFIYADDVGWGDFSCNNPRGKIHTPNIDRLAAAGMRFTDAHPPAALCAPSRYSVLTGNYPWRGRDAEGVWGFNVPSDLLPGQQTIAHLLGSAGYDTAMFGKAGIGGTFARKDGRPDLTQPMTDGPVQWGFDYSYIILRGHQSPPRVYIENGLVQADIAHIRQIKPNGELLPAPPWNGRTIGETLVTRAYGFLDRHVARADAADHPFFIYFNTAGAHGPNNPPDKLLGTPLRGVTGLGDRADMVLEVDVILGKLTEALRDRGLLENTLIIVSSDNGGLPFERDRGHDSVGGLRGRKAFIPEGGHRVPFIAAWPGHIPAGTVRHQVIGVHDIVPTALELAGVTRPADQALDSVSLVPVLLGLTDDATPVRQTLVVQSSFGRDAFDDGGFSSPAVIMDGATSQSLADESKPPSGEAKAALLASTTSDAMAHCLYEGDWKLTINIADQPAALYDLAHDLGEQHNLIDEPAQSDRVARLLALYRKIRASKRSTD